MTDSADFDDVVAEAPPPPRVEPPKPASRPTGWRTDPAWRLVSWDEGYFADRPADVPPQEAELAQPDLWASMFVGSGRIVATWSRVRD